MMKPIQVVLDDATLKAADREAKRAKINRSELVRRALTLYVGRQRERDLEAQQLKGYAARPVKAGEFDAWDRELTWPAD